MSKLIRPHKWNAHGARAGVECSRCGLHRKSVQASGDYYLYLVNGEWIKERPLCKEPEKKDAIQP